MGYRITAQNYDKQKQHLYKCFITGVYTSANGGAVMTRGKTRLSGKNLLFAELIIVILFFSVASAGCVLLFAEAYSDGKQSRDLTEAVIIAQNTAELFKAANGDIELFLNLLREHGDISTTNVFLENGEGWGIHKTIISDYIPPFDLHIDIKEDKGFMEARISVTRHSWDEEKIPAYELTVGVIP
jgi:hypothetical protein